MKTLFMHGMGARPKTWQLDCLKNAGLEPYALHLDYTRKPQKFDILKKYIQENQIEFLVGRSHGGFMGYWLSEELGLPCLLMNPQLSLSTHKQTKPPIQKYISPLSCIALGTNDRLVNADRSLLYIEKYKSPESVVKIKMLDEIGHWLDMDTFSEVLNWSLQEIKKLDL